MAFIHRVDWGNLSCIPLRASGDPDEDLTSEPVAWTIGGEAFIDSRILILKEARKRKITLERLTRELGVKWRHFDEWAEKYDENTLSIFLGHLLWKDELLSNADVREKLGIRSDQITTSRPGDHV